MNIQQTDFSSWPVYEQDEIEAVSRVLSSGRSNYWSGGEGRQFEEEFAAYIGVQHAVAVANGTVALDLALHALEIGANDEVIVTPRTFMASVSSIVNAGARPVFADVDRDSGNITVNSVRRVLTPRTRAIIAVHLAGWPCDMEGLMNLAEEHGLYVIEDCAQAHGATCNGRSVGSFGHIGCFSFCTDKIITTGGEGGMVVTNDRELWQRMWSYKDHGKSWEAVYNREHPPGFRWLHEGFGTNWRLTEMQSAIGRVQLRKLPEWKRRRRENAQILIEKLGLAGLRIPEPAKSMEHSYYKFYAYVRPEQLTQGWSRDRIITELQDVGVPCMQGICPEVYLEKAFDGTGMRPGERLPGARELGETSLMLPVHPTLSKTEVEEMAGLVVGIMQKAS